MSTPLEAASIAIKKSHQTKPNESIDERLARLEKTSNRFSKDLTAISFRVSKISKANTLGYELKNKLEKLKDKK